MITRRIASYLLAALGVLPAMIAIRLLQAGDLSLAAWLGVLAAAFWVAAFKVDRRG